VSSLDKENEIGKGARLGAALQSSLGTGDRETIEAATRSFVFYFCHYVLRRTMQRWHHRPRSFDYEYDWWEEGIEDVAVERVVEGAFSPYNSWKHIDDNGEFDMARTVIDDIWDQAVASWRIAGSESELTRLHERVRRMMN